MSADARRRVIVAHVDDVERDLDAFVLLQDAGNRLAPFHLQQAAEKLVRAIRLHHGLENTKDHDLLLLIDGNPSARAGLHSQPLPADDVWRARLRPLEWLSAYATTFRYPTSGGRFNESRPEAELRTAERTMRELLALARVELA